MQTLKRAARLFLFFGFCILVSECVVFGYFCKNIWTLYKADSLLTDWSVGDKLYGLILTTTHFFSNTIAAAELFSRLWKGLSVLESGQDLKKEDQAWSPAVVLAPLFCAALDSTAVVRAFINHHSDSYQAQAVLAFANSLCTCAWASLVILFLVFYRPKHTKASAQKKAEFVHQAEQALRQPAYSNQFGPYASTYNPLHAQAPAARDADQSRRQHSASASRFGAAPGRV